MYRKDRIPLLGGLVYKSCPSSFVPYFSPLFSEIQKPPEVFNIE